MLTISLCFLGSWILVQLHLENLNALSLALLESYMGESLLSSSPPSIISLFLQYSSDDDSDVVLKGSGDRMESELRERALESLKKKKSKSRHHHHH